MFCSSFSAGATVSIMVEIFSQSYRPSAFLIVGCINWMGLFVLGMIFPLIVVSDSWLDPSLQANLLPKADRELNNSNKLQRHASLELCPNTRPAQEYPRPARDAAVGLRSNMASGNSWFNTCPGLCIEQTFEFSLRRHRPAPKGKEIEMRFLFSFPSLSFACRITLVPSASLSFWESLFYQQFSSTCTFLRPRESQSWK